MERKMFCNLADYMAKEDINIAQLSRKIGVTENAIRGYVKNTFSRIDCKVAIKLCDYFNCNIGDLFQLIEI